MVHAIFYNFAEGEVSRHIPRVWDTATREDAIAARERGSVAALRRILGDLADDPAVARAADLATKAAVSAPTEGRVLYAALRTLPLPEEPVARLWHAATLLREHRGDGYIAALVTEGIGGTESHVLHALSQSIRAEKFGRVHHLPAAQLAAVVDGLRARGLVDGATMPEPAATSHCARRGGNQPSQLMPMSWFSSVTPESISGAQPNVTVCARTPAADDFDTGSAT